MISKEQIHNIISDKVSSDDCFVVEIKVSAGNKITVLIDSVEGLSLDYCIQINRLIEDNLDREVEDFELEVSTPGLGQAFKVLEQYKKNVSREVEVLPIEGMPQKGILTEVDDEKFSIEWEEKVKIDGTKKKEIKKFNKSYTFDQVKVVRLIVSF